jgi:uncharacterized protein YkwD
MKRNKEVYMRPFSRIAPASYVAQPLPSPVHPFAAQGVIVYPTEDQFLAVNNRLRAEVGRGPMQTDARLVATAQRYAQVCVAHGGVSHTYNGTELGQRVAQQGFDFSRCEEILAGGPPMLGRDPFALWKASKVGHYAAIIGSCTHCGFAVAYDRNGYGYWVGVYGTLRN